MQAADLRPEINSQKPTNQRKNTKMKSKIINYIRAGYPGLYLVSAQELKYNLVFWSVVDGLVDTQKGTNNSANDPLEALIAIKDLKEKTLILLRDFHLFLQDPNLVLDLADKRVRAVQEQLPDQIQYFRYCDDMILLARRGSHCREAFQAYLNALDELKLPYHQPKSVETYNKRFWNEKSKNPYCWSGTKGPGCIPWVQFVGYQVRYDGLAGRV
jgi:hypothetical protein